MTSSQKVRAILMLLLVVWGTAVISATAQTNTTPNEHLEPHHLLETIPHRNIESTNIQKTNESPDLQIDNPYPTWSRILFQSYRDNNWEIYHMLGDSSGTQLIRATNSTALDIHPHFNRGVSRIAFASTQDGNDLEIYTMDPDGQNKTLLTNNTTDDVYPVWSPDGKKIAFQTYRDGQPDIYVMNSDGTAQTRLTFDLDYDGMPEWSPDGTKIAFVSRRTGGFRIYTMNADGSNITKISTQPYSLRPKWSPNGNYIAFDADSNGDGWQELWLMAPDGTFPWIIAKKFFNDTADLWAGGWSPNGEQLSFTKIYFIQYQGNWYWTEAFSTTWNLKTKNIRTLNTSNLDWNPSWASEDKLPPISQIKPLPAYSSNISFGLNWPGQDAGVAGLRNYDIQYRIGQNGTWQDFLMGTPETSSRFSAQPGETVYFRSRATDNAYNIEPWPTQFDTKTTFYTYQVEGQFTDNRQMPLSSLDLEITPPPLDETSTDWSGNFLTRLLTLETHQLSINQPNYAPFITTPLDILFNQSRDFYLAPQNNLINNGNFEEETQPFQDWNVTGTMPVEQVDGGHSGKYHIEIGEECPYPCLSNPTLLDMENQGYNIGNLISDNAGNLYNVRNETLNNQAGIYLSQFLPSDNSWTTPELIVESLYVINPRAVFDSNDFLHLVWEKTANGSGIYASQRDLSGNWSNPVRVIVGQEGQTRIASKLLFSNNDHLNLLFTDPYGIYYLEGGADGRWFAPVQISDDSGDDYTDARNPYFTLGPDDTLHFIWRDDWDEDCCNAYDKIVYYTRSGDGYWGAKEHLFYEQTQEATWPKPKQLIATANGFLHFWGEFGNGLVHSIRTPDGQWSELTPLPTIPSNFQIVSDSIGQIHLIFNRNSDNRGIYYYRWNPTQGWLAETEIAGQFASRPSINMTKHDVLTILWHDSSGVHMRQQAKTALTSEVSISQVVTIPPDMLNPTLAFSQKQLFSAPDNLSGLQVVVDDGVTQTILPIEKGHTSWSHAWVDLSAWRGQTITVIFKVNQVAGKPPVEVHLDDISLGSAYPDIWVQVNDNPIGLPGEQVVFDVVFGNQGGVLADAGELRVTLPDGLAFIEASIVPSAVNGGVLTWAVGELTAVSPPQTITITAIISSNTPTLTNLNFSATISTSDPEIETFNNHSTGTIFIGEKVYLPIINGI